MGGPLPHRVLTRRASLQVKALPRQDPHVQAWRITPLRRSRKAVFLQKLPWKRSLRSFFTLILKDNSITLVRDIVKHIERYVLTMGQVRHPAFPSSLLKALLGSMKK